MSGDDPSAYLRPTQVRDTIDKTRIFDSKKWTWIPDDEEGFKSACIKSQKGERLVVELDDGQEVEVDLNVTQQMNPPKFEKIEDMAGLTYLNEASVLQNLRQRYYSSLIYTYSGLFCVAVNPYRMLPIYTNQVVNMYRGKRRTEMPPHIFSISDNAYRDMLQDRENQSILITGESGAGKTENTKKVIQYFAFIAPAASAQKHGNLEEQVIQANPVLEAFGNAKTIRNDNSSRFGKFIRIHFGPQGKIAGADIEFYLLEKSRVIHQQHGERCYHIFYQLLAGGSQDLLNSLLLTRQVKSYAFLANSEVTVDNVDDAQQFKYTQEAMQTLGFTEEEQMSMFKTISGILHFGNIEVKQRPREEWATIPNTTEAEKVAHILGIQAPDLMKSLIKPRIRVGNEYVQQGRNQEQVRYSIGALSKSLYQRMFRWLVSRVNKTLDTKARKNFFIGVLDIAGFEIFQVNSFEQLCINLTNEKLQQFFNHHMFVLEQEEYRKEGIKWDFIDFGLDLQPCIDLIEKPMGVLALLDEECLFPKGGDKSFLEKLNKNHADKSPNFIKAQKSRQQNAEFEIAHYAGTVCYTVTGWLDKNKDPLNESVVDLLKKSTDPFVAGLWADYSLEAERGRGKKGSQFVTVAQIHKQSLHHLLTTLRNTTPHFVRCIIPNELKRPGVIDAHLVLHQLRCNGVLEGIRICRKGFPNRLLYAEFRQRYAILAPKAIPAGFMDGRKACELLLSALQLETNEYRLGNSKVFFRAGVLGRLEDMRDVQMGIVLTAFQCRCRGYLMRKTYRKLLDQRVALSVLQRNIRKYLFLRDWKWWKLYTKVKPLLNVARTEDELRQKEEELNKLREKVQRDDNSRKELEEQQTQLMEEKNQLFIQLQREQEQCAEAEENVQRLMAKKVDLESSLQEMVERLDEEVDNNANISAAKRKLEAELEHTMQDLEDIQAQLQAVELEKAQKEKDCLSLDSELEKMNDNLTRVSKEKKTLEERMAELTNSLQSEEDKANRLNKMKIKLESQVQESHDELEKEKKEKAEVEKLRRKLEGDLKTTQEQVENISHAKEELEKTVASKDREIAGLQQKGEDDANEIATLQRRIRELEAKIEDLEDELQNEKKLRARTEKQRAELTKELEELNDKIEETGGVATAQIELNKKREAELMKMQADSQAQSEEHEKTVADMRKKHQHSLNDLQEQLDAAQKAKSRLEKERSAMSGEVGDLSSTLEDLQKSKANTDKRLRSVEEQLSEANTKVAEYEASLSALQSAQAKLTSENTELSSQLAEAESKVGSLMKAKSGLESQVEDLQSELQSETSAKQDAQSKLRHATAELATVQESLDEEQEGKAAVEKQLMAAKNEANTWKNKFETEATPRIEELEDSKHKMQAKLKEAEEGLEGLQTKYTTLEKTKARLAAELEDLNLDIEKERNQAANLEKKQKQIDKQITEWKSRYEQKEAECDQAAREARQSSTELLKLKGEFDEQTEQLEAAKKESRRLAQEVSDLEKQLSEGGVSAHELEKMKKKLEAEKEELTESLEEAEGQLEAEEAKVLKYQLEVSQLKQEMERRLAEKDDESDSMRKNHQRQLDSLQLSLEEEGKGRAEQTRQKKAMEEQLNELQSSIEDAQKAASDMAKKNKSLTQQLKEITALYEDEQRTRDEQHQLATKAEKRANELGLEVEDIRAQLEQAQRSLRTCDAEKTEAQERVSELTTSNSSLQNAKRKAEQQLATIQEENEDMETEMRDTADKLRKAMEQSARQQSDYMTAKDQLTSLEKTKAALDLQVRDLTTRLDEGLANTAKNAKKEAAKLQARIQELEGDLEAETKAKTDAHRNFKKSDRRNKETTMLLEEEKSTSQRLQDQVNSLNGKIRSLKREKEELEGELDTGKSRMRQLRSQLEEAEENASTLQSQITKLRGANRKKVVSPDLDDEN